MAILAGARVSAVDLSLPSPADGYGNGNNTVTATTFADLPTTACTVSITNPHPTASMLVAVQFGAWMSATANAIRCCPRVSGSVTLAAGPGGVVPGWGMVPRAVTDYVSFTGQGYATLPPGTATFTMQAYRESATGTQQCSYPSISVVPLRYVF